MQQVWAPMAELAGVGLAHNAVTDGQVLVLGGAAFVRPSSPCQHVFPWPHRAKDLAGVASLSLQKIFYLPGKIGASCTSLIHGCARFLNRSFLT